MKWLNKYSCWFFYLESIGFKTKIAGRIFQLMRLSLFFVRQSALKSGYRRPWQLPLPFDSNFYYWFLLQISGRNSGKLKFPYYDIVNSFRKRLGWAFYVCHTCRHWKSINFHPKKSGSVAYVDVNFIWIYWDTTPGTSTKSFILSSLDALFSS